MWLINKLQKQLNVNRLLLLITSLALLLRFYNFTGDPPSLYIDEVSHGYNAYSLLKTGKDEYGNFMPFFIRSFNIYNPPLSAYALVPSVAIFGLNETGIRFPAVLFGTFFIPLTYLLMLELTKNKKLALTAAFFIAISPWHLHFSRFYHEPNLTVFFSTFGIVLYLMARRKPYLYVLSAISFVIAVNFAHIGKVFVPLIILGLIIFFRQFDRKTIKYPIIAFVILLLSTYPHISDKEKSFHRAAPVSIFSNDVGDKKEKFIEGYLSHFSPTFLFIRGDTQGRHSVPGMGQVYVYQIPLLILGLYVAIKTRTAPFLFLLYWLLISGIPASLATPTPHAGRSLMVVPAWSIMSAMGLLFLVKNMKLIFVATLGLIAFYNLLTYLHLYHVHYPKEKAIDWADGYKDMSLYVGERYNHYERIAITRYWGHPYIYILFYTKFDPAKYHPQSENKYAFDKYEFFMGAPEESDKKTLFVSTFAHTGDFKKEVRLNNGDLFFVIHE